MEFTPTNVITLAVALVALIPSVLGFMRQIRKDKAEDEHQAQVYQSQAGKDRAEASAIIAGASTSLITSMQQHIDELEAELAEQRQTLNEQAALIESQGQRITVLEHQNEELRHGAGRLIHQLRSLNYNPVWTFDQLPEPKTSD